jgi:hypothetical protein
MGLTPRIGEDFVFWRPPTKRLQIRTRKRLADHRKLIGSGQIQPHIFRKHSRTLA